MIGGFGPADRATLDRDDPAGGNVAYLGFLRVLCQRIPLHFRVSPPETRLFLATVHGSSGPVCRTLQPQAAEVEHMVIHRSGTPSEFRGHQPGGAASPAPAPKSLHRDQPQTVSPHRVRAAPGFQAAEKPGGAARISGLCGNTNPGCSLRARGRKIRRDFLSPMGRSLPPHGVRVSAATEPVRKATSVGPRAWPGIACPFFGANRGRTKPLGLRLTQTPGVRSACARSKLQNWRGSFQRGRPSPPAPNYVAGPTPCAHRRPGWGQPRPRCRDEYPGPPSRETLGGFRKSAGHSPADR